MRVQGSTETLAALLLLLGSLCSGVQAVPGCLGSVAGGKGSITCVGGVYSRDIQPLQQVLAPFQNTSRVALDFHNITFTPEFFLNMLDLVTGVGGDKEVVVTLSNCRARDLQVVLARMLPIAAGVSYSFHLEGSTFVGNQLLGLAALLSGGELEVALHANRSTLVGNQVVLGGAVLSGRSATAIVTLAESRVANNQMFAAGILGTAGDATALFDLQASNVTRNQLTSMGLLASGRYAGSHLQQDNSSAAAYNTHSSSASATVTQQPVVSTLLGVLMGVVFERPGFDLGARLNKLQAEVCSLTSDVHANGTIGVGGLVLSDAASATLNSLFTSVRGFLCSGDKPGALPLGTLGPVLGGVLSSASNGNGGLDLSAIGGMLSSVLGGGGLDLSSLLGQLDLPSLLGGLLGSGASSSSPAPKSEVVQGPHPSVAPAQLPLAAPAPLPVVVPAPAAAPQPDLGPAFTIAMPLPPAALVEAAAPFEAAPQALAAGPAPAALPAGLPAGLDLSSIQPIIDAVLADPAAAAALPSLLPLIQSGGDLSTVDISSLMPIINAVMRDPAAKAQLPQLMSLLGGLGLGGSPGGGGAQGLDVDALLASLG